MTAEWKRKTIHMASGIVAVPFPFFFAKPWPVFLIAGAGIAAMAGIRYFSTPEGQLREMLQGVNRRSLGEFWFPLGIALLFFLARGQTVLYEIPLLILTFADAVAALIGVTYGKIPFEATEGKKSLEGSFSFFLTAFLACLLILLLATQAGREETVLVSLLLGLFLMLVEAVSWDGLDNLFIPVCGFFLLKAWLSLDSSQLLISLLVIGILAVVMVAFKKLSLFNTGAILGSIFMGYLFWFLGGWEWFLFPFIFLLVFVFFPPAPSESFGEQENFFSVLSTCGGGLIWLLYYHSRHQLTPDKLPVIAASFAVQLGIVLFFRLRRLMPSIPRVVPFALVIMSAFGFLAIGYQPLTPYVVEVAYLAFFSLSVLIGLASWWLEARSRRPEGFGWPGRWGWHFLLGLFAPELLICLALAVIVL